MAGRRIRTWLAAPGFSNHNDGRAIDLYCRLAGGRALSASRTEIPHWRTTWLYGWLAPHAAASLPSLRAGAVALGAPPGDGHRHADEPRVRHQRGAADASADAAEAGSDRGRPGGLLEQAAAVRAGREHRRAVRSTGPPPSRPSSAPSSRPTATRPLHLPAGRGGRTLGEPDRPAAPRLLDLFARAGERGVQVRVLVWDALEARRGASTARLHDAAVTRSTGCPTAMLSRTAAGALAKSHHQKLLVVQGRGGLVALCGGVDVNADRVHDLPPPPGVVPRRPPGRRLERVAAASSGRLAGSGDPLHDVHVRVTGPTALPLLRVFLRRWWARSGDRGHRSPGTTARRYYLHPAPAADRQPVRAHRRDLQRGAAAARAADVRSREVTVQDIWLRSILGARRFIYIEEQYLVSDCAAEAIRSVLSRLQHVTILIPPSEITDMPGIWSPAPGSSSASRRATRTRANCTSTPADARPAAVRTGRRAALLRPRQDGRDRRRAAAHRLGQLQQPGLGDRQRAGRRVVRGHRARPAGTAASGCGPQLWAHHLGVPASAVADPLRSRALWDTASTRLVCRYDPTAAATGACWARRTGSSIPPIAGRVIRVSRCSGRRPPLEGRDGRSPPQASFGNARRAVYKTALDG